MPMSQQFKRRLTPHLSAIAEHFGTPFHIYDEAGIRETAVTLTRAFATSPGFREYFAVKALPNPRILAILRTCGFGFDCSSAPELVLARSIGAHGHAMGFNYNGRLRPQELLLGMDGGVTRIRRAETIEDYLATLNFEANELVIG